jgi:hypothetical protein
MMTAHGPTPIAFPEGSYVPGACNIGAFEIRRRRAIGVIGVTGGVVMTVLMLAAGLPHLWRLLLLFPYWGGVFSLLQARRRFCAGFAMAGIANFADSDGGRRSVADEAAHKADMLAVLRMTRDSFAVAAVVTVVLVILPI